jgi:hypothetical protein
MPRPLGNVYHPRKELNKRGPSQWSHGRVNTAVLSMSRTALSCVEVSVGESYNIEIIVYRGSFEVSIAVFRIC